MKKFLLSFALLCLCCGTSFATKLVRGSLEPLKNEQFIQVCFDFSQTTYRRTLTVEDFIKTARRHDNWEKESLKCFIPVFFEKTEKIGLRAVLPGERTGVRYEMQIAPVNIAKDGCFNTTYANIVDLTTHEVVAVIEFDADDGDNNDEITFRDQMVDSAKILGGFLKSQIAKIRKRK